MTPQQAVRAALDEHAKADRVHTDDCAAEVIATLRSLGFGLHRIARLGPGIPTCPVCLYRAPDAKPGDPYPVPDHDCEDPT